jgi:hypothetical protein
VSVSCLVFVCLSPPYNVSMLLISFMMICGLLRRSLWVRKFGGCEAVKGKSRGSGASVV